ncbi:MAG: hypothetical protein Q4P33_05690 [Flaviflexus sp.]|nr:hypothetical protein [Flaviflexus sp.]
MTSRIAAAACALTLIAACSSEKEGQEHAEPPEVVVPETVECTDPLKDNPSEVDARELIACTTQALADTAGFVSTTTVDGEEFSTMRLNPNPFILDITYPDGTRIIADLTEAWVKTGGNDWVQADATSDDYVIAQATQIANTYLAQLDPVLATAGLPEDLTLTVTGTEEIDGEQCYVLEGKIREETTASDATYWITSDYRQVKTLVEAATAGQEGSMTMENTITEWDTKQDIEMPGE